MSPVDLRTSISNLKMKDENKSMWEYGRWTVAGIRSIGR